MSTRPNIVPAFQLAAVDHSCCENPWGAAFKEALTIYIEACRHNGQHLETGSQQCKDMQIRSPDMARTHLVRAATTNQSSSASSAHRIAHEGMFISQCHVTLISSTISRHAASYSSCVTVTIGSVALMTSIYHVHAALLSRQARSSHQKDKR